MSKTILVVDDSSTVRNLVAATLKDDGFDVIEACDGVDALAKLNGNKIHLVVSDVNMPNMDGLTFVGKMKEKPEYKCVPVIMLTTEDNPVMRERGRTIGVTGWIVKPFDDAAIVSVVRRVTGARA